MAVKKRKKIFSPNFILFHSWFVYNIKKAYRKLNIPKEAIVTNHLINGGISHGRH